MSRWPKTVLQFEDFQLQYAHTLLQRYKHQHLVFNDDIQVSCIDNSFYFVCPFVDLLACSLCVCFHLLGAYVSIYLVT